MAVDPQNLSESSYDDWIQKRNKTAENIVRDKTRMERLLVKSKNWLNRFSNSLNGEAINSLTTMFRMISAWLSGKYTDISNSTLMTIVLALLYFVSPIDLIPDFIPVVGFLDDIFMIGFSVNRIASELNKYRFFERIGFCRPLLCPINCDPIENIIINPGWLTEKSDCQQEKEAFQAIYPNSRIIVLNWKSCSFWEDACRQVDHEASDQLLDQLEHLSGKTVLVGHSLGARIIVRALVKIFKYDRIQKYDIDHFILMGAAVDRTDPDLDLFSSLGDIPVYNFYRKTDRILGYIYQSYEHKEPLGLLGSLGNNANFIDLKIAGTEEYLLEVTRNVSFLASSFGTKPNYVKLFSSDELVGEITAIHHSFVEYTEFYRHCMMDNIVSIKKQPGGK